jgi:hypothetical protein
MFWGINWIAVFVATALLEVLGYLWYGVLFARRWSEAMAIAGHSPDAANVAVMQSLGALNTLAIVLGLFWLTHRLGARSLAASVSTALAAWFFFDLTTQALEYLYMGLPGTVMAINIGYQFLAYLLAGAVLGLIKARTPKAA